MSYRIYVPDVAGVFQFPLGNFDVRVGNYSLFLNTKSSIVLLSIYNY